MGDMLMELHTRRPFGAHEEDVGGWHVVHVTGEVDAGTAGILPTLVIYAVRRGARKVCLDLTRLERVDGSGAAALRRCSRAARFAGGRLAMICPDDPVVADVLADTGVSRDVPVLEHRDRLAGPPLRHGRPPARAGAGATRSRRRADAL